MIVNSTEIIKERLKKLLIPEKAFGIAINGEWGVGKTFFWHELVKDNFADKKIAYISLFGISSLNDIRVSILLQTSPTKKKLSWVDKKIITPLKNVKSSLKLDDLSMSFGVDALGSIFTLLTNGDFKNVIVCFDDFERMSNNLKLKDVLGLISELKEQKECHVVMILNKGELKDEELSKYKDKIIDYDFNYAPTPEKSYSLVKENLKVFQDYPLAYFQKHNISNIRVIKRVINALNDYAFAEDLVKEHKEIERELVENILKISTINAIDLSIDFEALSDYTKNDHWDDLFDSTNREKVKNEDFEKLLSYINFGNSGYFHISDFTHNVISYVKNSFVEIEFLEKGIEKRIESEKYSSVKNEIYDCSTKARYDLNYTFEEYTKNLYKLFEENKSNITQILDSGNFIFYIEELIKYDNINKEKYTTFAIEVLKQYLQQYKKNQDEDYDPFKEKNIEDITSFHSELNNYYESLEAVKIEEIDSSKKLIELVNEAIKGAGDKSASLLSLVKEEDIEKYFYEDINFVKNSLMLLSWEKKSVSADFVPYKEKLLKVMSKISEEGTEEQKEKIKMLLKGS